MLSFDDFADVPAAIRPRGLGGAVFRRRSSLEPSHSNAAEASRYEAQDVAQERTTSFTTWPYGVARSFCIKMRRRQRLQPSRAASTDEATREIPSRVSAPDDDASAHEVTTALDRAISRLEHQRVVPMSWLSFAM